MGIIAAGGILESGSDISKKLVYLEREGRKLITFQLIEVVGGIMKKKLLIVLGLLLILIACLNEAAKS